MPYNYARGRSLENRRESDKVRKKQVAEYLKNICFRFRTESDVFSQKYEKYSKISAGE